MFLAVVVPQVVMLRSRLAAARAEAERERAANAISLKRQKQVGGTDCEWLCVKAV